MLWILSQLLADPLHRVRRHICFTAEIKSHDQIMYSHDFSYITFYLIGPLYAKLFLSTAKIHPRFDKGLTCACSILRTRFIVEPTKSVGMKGKKKICQSFWSASQRKIPGKTLSNIYLFSTPMTKEWQRQNVDDTNDVIAAHRYACVLVSVYAVGDFNI